MNKGLIVGTVRNKEGYAEKGAVVQLIGLKIGLNNWLPIFNPGGGSGRIHIVYSDSNGEYKVPFLWSKTEIGDFGSPVSVGIFALHKTEALRGNGYEKRFFIAPDLERMISQVLPMSLSVDDLISAKGFKLPGAFKTILTPRLSTMDMVGIGYCDIWLGL